MIEVQVYGSTKANRAKVRSYISKAYDLLFESNIDAELEVFLKKKLDADGYTLGVWDEDSFYSEIEINSTLSELELGKTVFHEMMHFKQLYSKKLEYKSNYSVFDGIYYSEDRSFPWEKEAEDFENCLQF